jgi:hypothetical protein
MAVIGQFFFKFNTFLQESMHVFAALCGFVTQM